MAETRSELLARARACGFAEIEEAAAAAEREGDGIGTRAIGGGALLALLQALLKQLVASGMADALLKYLLDLIAKKPPV